ncbi:MAG: Uroporphyrinogen decarboxylase [Verrucomicrobia bacterium ADurb.Bin118]|jgi:uroporphyrinogen decarboxylase|nr:MAG: Uroporphyrinogen decarboxylase [Verrucomicrobia bacterium ADurb.Bin118]
MRSVIANDTAPRPITDRQRFLNACHCRPVDRPPVWLMRQAGRALPEYRALKEKHTFVELVQTPDLAAEVTLQPVRRFGFDAAILFSDILVVNEALGQPYRFRETGGIQMEFAVRSAADMERLQVDGVRERLDYQAQALRLVRAQLQDRTALLGFAGAPWTLANFMMEGGSSHAFTSAKTLFYQDPLLFGRLMEKLTTAVTELLRLQIEAGADAVQLFDSLGGLLAPGDYAEASARWMKEIIAGLGARVPVIVFGRGVHASWDALVDTGAQVLGIDWQLRLGEAARQIPPGVAVQGNLDPFLLTATPDRVARATRELLQEMRDRPGYIFNLGHGVPPAAKLENIACLVETVRGLVPAGACGNLPS